MLELPRQYCAMIFRSWGRAISGPVLGFAGLILLLAQQVVEGPIAATILRDLGWGTLILAGVLILVAQYEVWKTEFKTREGLTSRLIPRAIIQNLTPRVWPIGQAGITVTGKEYYFDVFNSSEAESLENVRVEVAEIVPDAIGYPNAPLHIRNDSYETREFSINAGSVRQIDLVTGPVNAPRSQQDMIIAHTVNQHRTAIPRGTYKVTVRVSAKNTVPVFAVFETWVENNELQCVLRNGT